MRVIKIWQFVGFFVNFAMFVIHILRTGHERRKQINKYIILSNLKEEVNVGVNYLLKTTEDNTGQ